MEDLEIKALLRQYDQRLQKSISLNLRNIADIQKLKASSALKPLKGTRLVGILSGIGWEALVVFLICRSWSLPGIFFVVSAGINVLLTGIAIGVYIRHLVLLRQFDNSLTVVEAQQKLVMLMTSNMEILRLMFLQLPVFFTFYITFDWIRNSPLTFWLIQAPVVLLAVFAGTWLYRNLDFRNQDRKWFKFFVRGTEWTSVQKASGLLNQIEEFKREAAI